MMMMMRMMTTTTASASHRRARGPSSPSSPLHPGAGAGDLPKAFADLRVARSIKAAETRGMPRTPAAAHRRSWNRFSCAFVWRRRSDAAAASIFCATVRSRSPGTCPIYRKIEVRKIPSQ